MEAVSGAVNGPGGRPDERTTYRAARIGTIGRPGGVAAVADQAGFGFNGEVCVASNIDVRVKSSDAAPGGAPVGNICARVR